MIKGKRAPWPRKNMTNEHEPHCPSHGRSDLICYLGKIWKLPIRPDAEPYCELVGECEQCVKATGGNRQ